MIPRFPEFKKLQFSDKPEVETIVRRHPPYSDFNFISLWSWDAKGEIEISELNGNLAVRFLDYMTDEPFYSFIGTSQVAETAHALLERAAKNSETKHLKLVPEVSTLCIGESDGLLVAEDPDNFDYLYELEKLKSYEGNKLRGKRNLSNRYKRRYLEDTVVKMIDLNDGGEQKKILRLIERWVANKAEDVNENEFAAIERIMSIPEPQDLACVGLYIKGELAGFVINEILKDEHVMLHFEKADHAYVGIYAYLMQENARILYNFGKRILNYEQDLGLPGLRLAKKAHYPSHHLKKFIISRA